MLHQLFSPQIHVRASCNRKSQKYFQNYYDFSIIEHRTSIPTISRL